MARIRLALVTALILNFSTAVANNCQKCITAYNTSNYVSTIEDWTPFSVRANSICRFEMNDEVIFEGACGIETTRISEEVIVLGSPKDMYFVYAASFHGEWSVTWNGEPFASHAHNLLGIAQINRTGETLCILGANFNACILNK